MMDNLDIHCLFKNSLVLSHYELIKKYHQPHCMYTFTGNILIRLWSTEIFCLLSCLFRRVQYIHIFGEGQRWARFWKKFLTEVIPMLYYLGKVSIKQLYCFKSQRFWKMKHYKYFYAKNLIGKAIVSFKTPEFLKVKQYRYFFTPKKFESSKRLYRFKPQNL